MQVVRELADRPALAGELFYRPVKERAVVGFEPDLSAERQRVSVQAQESRRGQAEFGVPAFGPGIAEVDVDALCFTRGEELRQTRSVKIEEADVVKPSLQRALHGDDHRVRHLFDGYEQRVRHGGGGVCGEAALAAAELQLHMPESGEALQPLAAVFLGGIDQNVGAFLHSGGKIAPFSHSHGFSHSCQQNITFARKHQESSCAARADGV